ncbi:MAG: thioredoxin domain-containing protein [Gammaproteobacteria bacterium]|nr:thioredoxin domain-containing protein [Gammaproteobacteria bacterium]
MNRLGEASSPYLLQHADNPVHWHPWDEEALRAARESGRPVLLSVGYSACHWCHVMAHESFEDDATAEVMNELFVNVKVDREERPDLDKVYQTSHQLLTRRAGGWPLTVFLTHDELLPFFAGTYFPKAPRFGMPAFTDLLRNVAAYYAGRREEARGNGKAVREMLARIAAPGASLAGELDEQPLTNAFEQMRSAFDPVHGGTQGAPKFPRPADMELLIRRAAQPGGEPAREMLETTLDAMAAGGLNDHLGGGFFRYSVDARWEIPHFEKMLYDNAALLSAYALGWQLTGKQRYAEVADATAGWLLRDMRHEGGAFFAALEADSEGEEGLYYLWTPEQVGELLPENEYDGFAARYGLNRRPNFEESAWHLVERPAPDGAEADFSAARQRLLEERTRRERPMRDEKLLTAWNAMAVRALAIAGRCLERPDLTAAAEEAADFIIAEMMRDGRLLSCWTDGRAGGEGFLDDYAFFIDALLELGGNRQATAEALAQTMLDSFEDPDNGGFYFTSARHERLIHRPRSLSDDALPSGAAVAARALLRLSQAAPGLRYAEAAERTLRAGWEHMNQHPLSHTALCLAADEWLRPNACRLDGTC